MRLDSVSRSSDVSVERSLGLGVKCVWFLRTVPEGVCTIYERGVRAGWMTWPGSVLSWVRTQTASSGDSGVC